MNAPTRVAARALTRVDALANGCVISRYSTGSHGYAQIGWAENGVHRMGLVHRIVWEAERGPIPEGLQIDHRCFERRCCNVDHLRLLTPRANVRRRAGRDWTDVTVCRRGHGDDALVWRKRKDRPGQWECAPCARANHHEAHLRRTKGDAR